MKILIVLCVYLFGFGYAYQEATQVTQPEEIAVKAVAPATVAAVEAPVMDVMLDTVEISVVAPVAIASAAK